VDPDPLPGTRLQRLEAALAEVDASMEVVASDELVEHLGERLRGEGVQRVALGSGELLDRHTIAHALAETGLEVQGTGGPWGKKEEGRHWLRTLATCDVGITCAEGIAAETGTLLETPREVDERAISLLPERHIAIVEEAKVVETVEELVARWRREGEPEGSAVLVTGPSRTADIEKELVLGVHGPLAVHVLVVR
jgi:L-lactate utilization protein LutC